VNKEGSTDNSEPKKSNVFTEKLKPDIIGSASLPLSSEAQQHKRILVVDDNPDIVFTLRVGIESDPTVQVFGFDNPVTALVEFKPNFYDLLLIDVNMPLMDGFQLAQNLVRRDLNVRVCFMTSGEINMAAAREVHPLKSIGCFIKKPISAEQLIKRIKAELE
jgi:two-component system alkaline phosphatase synthesis response regulator PhoP